MSGKTLEERFNELCKIVQSLPKDGEFQLSNENKLKFYAYFKQVTEGDVNTTQPYFFNVIERAKWDAWNGVKGMSKEQAMQGYLDEMREILKDAPYDNDISQKMVSLVE